MEVKRRNPFAWLLIAGGVLLILAAATWLVNNQPGNLQATPTVTPASAAQVQRVTLQEAKAAYDDGSAVFVDVRANATYAISHIPGAISIPINELPSRLNELDSSAWIIPY